MVSGNDEMFSTLGYEALDIILGIQQNQLSEMEKRNLVKLVSLSETDENIKDKISDIRGQDIDDLEKKEMLLSLLEQK